MNPASSARARRPFSWVEYIAIPIALSVMEAQPLALALIVITQVLSAGTALSPLEAGGITLLELALLWWAMFTEHLARRAGKRRRTFWLHLISWIVAVALLIGPYTPSLLKAQDILQALILLALITWLWRHGIANAQIGFEYNRISISFKIGFGIALGALLIATAVPVFSPLRSALPTALPVFFLSGLIALSLTRLGVLRAARLTPGSHADPTRPWLLALTILSVGLIVLVVIVESIFSFSALEAIVITLNPLWNAIGTVIYWLLYGIVFLLSPIFYLVSFILNALRGSSPPPKVHISSPISAKVQSNHSQALIAQAAGVGRWVLLALALFAIALLVVATVRRWFMSNQDESVEEVREGLDARSLLMRRLREWLSRRRQQAELEITLEPLDPMSARAHYRELLQKIAVTDEILTRRQSETPDEYERRLNAFLREQAQKTQGPGDMLSPVPSITLDSLTHDYEEERYGGKSTSAARQARWQVWMPQLILRLTGKKK